MHNSTPMCDNLEAAKQNRERIKQGFGDEFYTEQERIIAHWTEGKPLPVGLVVGEDYNPSLDVVPK